MPWKERTIMDEKRDFINRLIKGECMSHLCREYGISRPSGYKFYDRYIELGLEGLKDKRNGNRQQANRTAEMVEQLICKLRKRHPSWGPKKLKAKMDREERGLEIPAASTIGEILKRNHIELGRPGRQKPQATPSFELRQSHGPNEIWGIDFKGQFRMLNGKYCYPLTVTDHYSRFILCCEALESTSGADVRRVLERVFQQFGLPQVIRSDNGSPFASCGLQGLSKLSAWWISLGITAERIEPGHPEQNGRHERMHLTLKQETTRPPSANLLAQQERFDQFVSTFNFERPHEALEMKYPKDIYRFSERKFSKTLEEVYYPLDDKTLAVKSSGHVRFRTGVSFYLSLALIGYTVGFREIDLHVWQLHFMELTLGFYHSLKNKFYSRLIDLQADLNTQRDRSSCIAHSSNALPFDYENCSNF